MSTGKTENPIESIAIVGMSGRFPGAADVDEFWQNLQAGKESIEMLSDDELRSQGIPDSVLAKPNYVKARSAVDGMELFDASFFGFNPNEARILDPQHRLFLECAWAALENAGYDVETYPGTVGVFGCASSSNYFLYNLFPNREVRDLVGAFQLAIGNDREFLPTRVSYKLNLKGPSVNVQTACSSSLVAVHLACQSLLNYQSDMCLAGGVSIRSAVGGYYFTEGGILSPDGHCRAFDARAHGTIFGSGLGIVVLKRLRDALDDGDEIYAVIRGSAVNNDGSDKVGYTAPGVEGQTRVIAEAQAIAGVDPDTIDYVEAHGTATALGDPIEVAALTQVFHRGTSRRNYCGIGSVKSNVGHLDAAAGVTGLIKTALMVKHGKQVPSLHYREPNPQIDFASSPFFVGTELRDWQVEKRPRRAGVSSFGIGGTNAHLILESVAPREAATPSVAPHLLFLSARTASALETATANLAQHLKLHPEVDLGDVAHTLHVGRAAFDHRRMLVCTDVDDAVTALETASPRRLRTAVHEPAPRNVVFMFPGQGAQYPGMGAGLYDGEPVFRRHLDACLEVLEARAELDLRPVLYPAGEPSEEEKATLSETGFAQPALFAVEYALARLWMEWGVSPEALIGHSIGEYVAACLAGVFSLEDALALVARRGRLMQDLPGGSMLSVPLSAEELSGRLGEDLALAAVNGPSVCAVSGTPEAIAGLEARLAEEQVAFRRLHTSHAFHSAMMDPILDEFTEAVEAVERRPPQIRFLSNVSGTWITDAEATDPRYWARHLRETVRFSDGVRELLKDPSRVYLEVGPGRALSALTRQHREGPATKLVLSSLRPANELRPDAEVLLDARGQLWLAGVEEAPGTLHAGEGTRRVPLPSYPFERRRYWIEAGAATEAKDEAPAGRIQDLSDWFFLPSWKRSTPLAVADGSSPEASWLVFSDDCGLGDALDGRLREAGEEVFSVRAGTGYGEAKDGTFTVAPGSRADYVDLLRGLEGRRTKPLNVVHLWSVTGEAKNDLGELDEVQGAGFDSLLCLVQAVGEALPDEEVHLGVVSNDLHAVLDGDRLSPAKATLLGPARIAPAEYPNLSCSSIDVVLPGSAEGLADLAGSLVAELGARRREPVVAYRGGYRWIQTFDAVRLEAGDGEARRLRDRGVYLITGGLGGVGLTLARHLAEAVRARLVLVSRSALPAREEWKGWLESHPEADETSRRILEIQRLEEAGAEVWVASADVAHREEMEEVVRRAVERFGAIHGVIHAAGLPGGGLIQLKTRETAAEVLAPKVRGSLVLDSVLRGRDLDFFVLCSSLASILGGVGKVDYCGANAFLDAFAHLRSERDGGGPTVSICWDTWGEVGMAVKAVEAFGSPHAAGNGSGTGPSGASVPAQAGEAAEHPLFDRVRRSGDEEVYSTEMSADRQWVVGEHLIGGRPTLVGTAYLEMARAAFERRASGAPVRIEDVLFVSPLSLEAEGAREVETVLQESSDGVSFVVQSRPLGGGDGARPWQEHARGRLAPLSAEAAEAVDLQKLLARCDSEVISPSRSGSGGSEPAADAKPAEMSFGPRWKSLQKIYIGENEAVALLELPAEFADDLGAFGLHPALLDLATSFAIARLGGGGLYLPFAYQAVDVRRPMTGRSYSHVRFAADGSGGAKEAVTLDISVLDEEGNVLVEVAGFTMKRVSEKLLQALAARGGRGVAPDEHEPAAPAAAKGRSVPTLRDAIRPQEGVEAFRRILSRDGLRQVIVSTLPFRPRVERARTASSAKLVEEMEERSQAAPPTHARPSVKTELVAPRNELEEQIAAIWQRVLGIEQIGVNDDFIELGGHSLLAIQIMSQMREAFQVNLQPDTILNSPTVATLAEAILQALAEAADSELIGELLDEVEGLSDDEAGAMSTADTV